PCDRQPFPPRRSSDLAIRPYDICVRYAGDEFVVVLSGCGAEEAEQKRRSLQTAVESCPFEVQPGRMMWLGVRERRFCSASSAPQDRKSTRLNSSHEWI